MEERSNISCYELSTPRRMTRCWLPIVFHTPTSSALSWNRRTVDRALRPRPEIIREWEAPMVCTFHEISILGPLLRVYVFVRYQTTPQVSLSGHSFFEKTKEAVMSTWPKHNNLSVGLGWRSAEEYRVELLVRVIIHKTSNLLFHRSIFFQEAFKDFY